MEEIVALILPKQPIDILLYVIFILALINLAILPDGNGTPGYLLTGVMLAAVVAKVDLIQFVDVENFFKPLFTIILGIIMTVLPFMAAGLTRKRGRKGGASVPVSIIVGILGGLFTLGLFLTTSL